MQNLIRRAEVQDNIAAVPLQIDEIAGTRFNEPLVPVRSDSVRAAQFFLVPAVALQGSIIGITINNEKVARAIGIEPIDRDSNQIDGRHGPYPPPRGCHCALEARADMSRITPNALVKVRQFFVVLPQQRMAQTAHAKGCKRVYRVEFASNAP
ncbi:hypothetical protein JQ609_21545 [Bradyrhizobium sp. AUGA SZCCT0169]|uniref:hypothetical protein n=1 Tax=unclassified Bradyrhizobium TaxID=2631580 RepID=UPI001BA49A27|nr:MULTISPECIES: hypothetical protein [unclassified Bradyrhizobium]MBR1188990.1 hypothetical protein [Bradyrhizobium sp. AUGA SZCCT0160]MBR1249500.1 hypothetical protein [Bradyrhizobium sp. AUGA SZCCT0169]